MTPFSNFGTTATMLVLGSSLASAALVQVSTLGGSSCATVLSTRTIEASLSGAPIQCLAGDTESASSFFVLSPTNVTLDAFACPTASCAQPAACTKVYTATQAAHGTSAGCSPVFRIADDSLSSLPISTVVAVTTNTATQTDNTGSTAGLSTGLVLFVFAVSFLAWYGQRRGWWSQACAKNMSSLPAAAMEAKAKADEAAARQAAAEAGEVYEQPAPQQGPSTTDKLMEMAQKAGKDAAKTAVPKKPAAAATKGGNGKAKTKTKTTAKKAKSSE
ncbi:hypothetical protein BC831DRAFT_474715 [Entophlyctis helioformis]|nr:hypothetical protein BC831DRAFT_474715 [Entophlyctis helioformis]